MLAWLQSLLSRFRRDERLLFAYWDGKRQRRIDPLVAWRSIHDHPECNWVADMRLAANPLKDDGQPFYPIAEVRAAEDRLLTMIRDVFDVPEWSEEGYGLTLDETNELLGKYLLYISDLKKKRSSSPTSPAPSESRESPPGLEAESSPPSNWPDSISTETGSSAAEPGGCVRPSVPV